MILLEAFKGQDGIIRFDGVVRNLKRSINGYLRPKNGIIFIFQIIFDIIDTICIDHRVDEVVGEVKTIGIIYGNDAPTPISVTPRDVRGLIYTPNFYLAELDVEGEKQTCILKDYDCHPVTEQILHLDFLRFDTQNL